MKKRINSVILFLCILVSILSATAISLSKFYTYKGSNFLKKETFGYVEKLQESVSKYVASYGDMTIKDGELISEKNQYRRLTLKNDEGIYQFDLEFCNGDEEEVERYFKLHYAKQDIYKGNPNANSYSFMLIGKYNLISYIFDPSKELRYTQYESKIEGRFDTLTEFSFKEKFSDISLAKNSCLELFGVVGNNYKKTLLKENSLRIILYCALFYCFTLAALMIIKKHIYLKDIIVIDSSMLLLFALPYLVIFSVEFDLLYSVSLVIGMASTLILDLVFRKNEEN